MLLSRAYLFPGFIVLTSPHERSAYPIQSILEVTLQATKPRTLVDGNEHLWCDVKTIKSGKRYALGSDISKKQSIVYTYACIEEASIVRNLSHTDSKDVSHSNSWNDEDHDFDYQLDQWGVEK